MSLIVVCCYTPGRIHKATEDALIANSAGMRIQFIANIDPDNPFDYGRRLGTWWDLAYLGGNDLAIVEPDIVIRADVADAFLNCPGTYCAYPYDLQTDVMPALGCTRFRHEFIARYPDAMQQAVDTGVGFRQFDVAFQRYVLVGQHGEQPHVHLPKVEHLNEAKRLLPEANPEPLMMLPALNLGHLSRDDA